MALAWYLQNTLFHPFCLREICIKQLVTVLIVWFLSGLFAKFYYYERNLTYTKQLQRFLLFSVLWAVLFFLVEIIAPSLFLINTKNALGFYFVVFFSKTISIVTLFQLRKSVLRYQQNILVYNSETGNRFIKDITQLKRTGYNVYKAEKEVFAKKSLEALKALVQKEQIKTIFLPVEVAFKKLSEHILDLSWSKEVEIKLIADYNSPISGIGAQTFGLTQIVNHTTSPLDMQVKKIQKRIFDILFSSLVILLFLSWFIPLVGVCVFFDSRGPLFFIQHRPGRHGKIFRCFKLRSMAVNNTTEKSATRNDIRITRVGKFMRRTSIDELPQFFNVLFGQMSIVGPRPNLMSQNNHYIQVFDEYHKRMYLKPGITGLAQVSGARGGIEDDIDMKHRVKYDIFYIRNWSFALDIKIIIRTVLNIFRGEEKAY